MTPIKEPAQKATSSALNRLVLGEQLPLATRLALFLVVSIVLMVSTIVLSPKLVMLGPWGYVGGFTINCLSSALVVLPGPGFAALIIMVRELDPFLLGTVAGIGGTLGELSGYWLGAQGRAVMEGNRVHRFLIHAMGRVGGGILLSFGLLPFLPVDAAGVVAGASRYPVPKFLIYLGIGKVLMSIALLYLAARAFEWAEPYLKWLG